MNDHNIFYDGNQVIVFGKNCSGQLELGDNMYRNGPTLLMMDKEIHQIALGENHTFILKNNGDVLAFGYNICGQLGTSNYENKYKPTLLMKSWDVDPSSHFIPGPLGVRVKSWDVDP